MLTFKGFPEDGGCYIGYYAIKDGKVVGEFGVCGDFRNIADTVFTEQEKSALRNMSKKVYEMPSEWGVLGVGESPTEPYYEAVRKHPGLYIF